MMAMAGALTTARIACVRRGVRFVRLGIVRLIAAAIGVTVAAGIVSVLQLLEPVKIAEIFVDQLIQQAIMSIAVLIELVFELF